jgi:hypothetical protein
MNLKISTGFFIFIVFTYLFQTCKKVFVSLVVDYFQKSFKQKKKTFLYCMHLNFEFSCFKKSFYEKNNKMFILRIYLYIHVKACDFREIE